MNEPDVWKSIQAATSIRELRTMYRKAGMDVSKTTARSLWHLHFGRCRLGSAGRRKNKHGRS